MSDEIDDLRQKCVPLASRELVITRITWSRDHKFTSPMERSITEADTLTIRLGAAPSGLSSAYLLHPPIFFTGRMTFLPPNQQRQSTEGN